MITEMTILSASGILTDSLFMTTPIVPLQSCRTVRLEPGEYQGWVARSMSDRDSPTRWSHSDRPAPAGPAVFGCFAVARQPRLSLGPGKGGPLWVRSPRLRLWRGGGGVPFAFAGARSASHGAPRSDIADCGARRLHRVIDLPPYGTLPLTPAARGT